MDELRLAQLLCKDTSDNNKLEILKDIDVSCTISGKSSAFTEKLPYLGYNCLHISVMKCDLELTQKLLNLGANPLQQGVQDSKTPLRKAIDYFSNGHSLIWRLMGVLPRQCIVSTLLSAQIKSNNPLNAKCKNGISHLHIACMFNHTEAVHYFIKSGESLDQEISIDGNEFPGYTPLHCAVRYSSTEAAVILITLGADIYQKNAQGMNAVFYLMERLLDAHDYLKMSFQSYCQPYEKEIERLESIMKVIVLKYQTDDSNLVENTGLSAFHLACTLKDTWIMQSYVCQFNFADINKPATCKSKIWSGWTPLHFAACCNLQTFEILLKYKADVGIKNSEGETALDLCFKRYSPEVAFSYLSKEVIMSDKSTELSDVMLAISKDNSCQTFLQRLTFINIAIPLESPFWPGYNLLHMAISMNQKTKFPNIFYAKTAASRLFGYLKELPKNTTKETYSIYYPRFEMILRKGCSVHSKNADGLTPIHLAFKLHKLFVVEELLSHAQINVVGSGNISFLHIACAMGKKDVVKRLLSRGAEINSPVTSSFEYPEKPRSLADVSESRKILIRRNSTPLHIAVIFKMEEVIEVLVEKYPDVHAKDELGYTPIHLSLTSTKKIAQLLFSRISKLREVKMREDGLSHLHAAAFADDEKAIKKLVQNGADVKQTYHGQTPLHLAIEGEKAVRVLVDMGADVCAESQYHKTPLDLAMKDVKSKTSNFLFQKLKSNKLKISNTITSGLTTLHVACAILDVDWSKSLLKSGANPNAQMTDSDGRTNTPMHLLIANFEAESTRLLIDKFSILIRLLLEHGADVTVHNNWGTPLHAIIKTYCSWTPFHRVSLSTTISLMLSSQRSFKLNPADTNGTSHFHLACLTNNIEVVEKYLNDGVDVNLSTCPFAKENAGFTPLHFAIVYKNLEIVLLLIQRGANVKAVDTNGNTPLHVAIKAGFIHLPMFGLLLESGADINAENLKDETPIMILISRHTDITHEQIHFFMSHGSLIDITEMTTGGDIMTVTRQSDVELVIDTLIEFCDIKNQITKGLLAIHNIVSVESCQNLTRDHYLYAIQRLISIGSDVDEQDAQGRRALDKALHGDFNNVSAIEALLLLGANINFIERLCRGSIDYYTLSFPNGRRASCSTVLRNHLWKMAMVKLDLNAPIQKAMEGKEPDDNTMKVIQLELEKAKNKRIFHSLTAKHFLSEWGAVIDYPTMSIGEREAVDNFFKQTDQLRQEFPEFAGLLTMQYRKALARVKLMQPVKNILVESGIDLPDLCLEAILKYFKNSELNFIIENAEDVPPCKRQRVE